MRLLLKVWLGSLTVYLLVFALSGPLGYPVIVALIPMVLLWVMTLLLVPAILYWAIRGLWRASR